MKKAVLLAKVRSFHPAIKLLGYLLLLGIAFGVIMVLQMGFDLIGLDTGTKGLLGMVYFTIYYGVDSVIILLVTHFALRVFDQQGLSEMGLKRVRGWGKDLGLGFILALGAAVLMLVLELALGWIRIDGFLWQHGGIERTFRMIYKAIVLCTSTAIVEEVFSRGYILQKLEQIKGKAFAIVFSSAVFGILHLFSASGTWATYVVPFSHTLYGILLALLFYVKRSLWAPIGFHFAWNFFVFEFFALSGYGLQRTACLVTELTGPTFWVGLTKSTLGPEVGALGIIVGILCIIIVAHVRKRVA